MFWDKQPEPPKDNSMQEKLDALANRIADLERATEPFRIGKLDCPLVWYYGLKDSRPQVSIKNAIEKIMAHLKMEFCHTPAEEAKVHLCKKKAAR